MYKNALKEDLIRVVEDLDGTVESTNTIAKLKTKIEKSSTFESDADFVKTLIKNCIDERVSRNEREATLEKQKIELTKLQLARLEKEVELQTAKNKALSLNPAAKDEEKQFETNIENMMKSIKTLSLPEKLNDYEKLKSIVLREFQVTPRECLNSFENAVKSSGETCIQFAARLTANFQYYCSLRKVNSFESLCDLLISDKKFETLNKETAIHIGIREAEDWFRPIDLAKECDIYIASRSGSRKETPIACGYNEDPFKKRPRNYKPTIKDSYPQNLERQNKNCYISGDSSHYARDCEKRFKPKEPNGHIHNRKNANSLKVKSEKQKSDEFAQQLQYVNIFVENQPVTALIDSGCQIPVLNSSLIKLNKPSEGRIILSSCFNEKRHIIEKGTIKPSLDKTKAVQNFPEPKNVKKIQSFLGLSGYFRKFIQIYSIIVKPLSDLLRDNAVFHFGPEQQLAFQTLRQKLSENPVLHIFKQGAKLELHTDASKFGYGAILLQQSDDNKLHPVHYFSKKTTPQEEKYSSYELEVLAVIESLKKFRNYLVGNKFIIVTDCSAFQKTMSKKQLTPKIARWALFLEDFNYKIIHRPGKQMGHVDCLSRYPVMTITYDEITTKLANSQRNDEYINSLKTLLENKQINDFVVKNDVLYKIETDNDVLVVPQQSKQKLLKIFILKDILVLIKLKACPYHIDFLGPLPSTNKNYNHILSIIDAFTKFVWLYPVKSTSSRDALEKLKLQEITFGNPHRIITNKGTAFTSKEFREYCENENIQHLSITTGIPRGNGQIEWIHSSLIPILSKLSIDDASKWYKFVPAVQRTLNSTISRSTQMTPFQLLTGVKMRTKQDLEILKLLEEEIVETFTENREKFREEAKRNILKMQEKNCRNFNKKRKKAYQYEIGDIVAIQRTQFGTGLKLRPKFFGPYEVVKENLKIDMMLEKLDCMKDPILHPQQQTT
ncbi:transposon Tf2-9 polyprotein [Trichonephila clavipes]|nr:transposon Tf2-9 polyprotein [Trichonephila clavipes]